MDHVAPSLELNTVQAVGGVVVGPVEVVGKTKLYLFNVCVYGYWYCR